MPGPLAGYRVIEIAGIGPGPFAAMMLADLGAEVIRVDRAGAVRPRADGGSNNDLNVRGRRSVAIDLKQSDGVATLLDLVEAADALIEGFRPGVMERLGVGPDTCLERNPRLIFGRMTGWGQDGPYAKWAGHDINYISLAGALAHMGRPGEPPAPPLNLIGDFGGGGMLLALGVVCGLLETSKSGEGQVVDAAMVDGSAIMMTMFWSLIQSGFWDGSQRGVNLLDGGAPFYDTYRCADGEYISVGAIEPQFYDDLLQRVGLADDPEFADQMDEEQWQKRKPRIAEVFATKSRDEWCAVLEYTDVCFAPVLRMDEAARHPHNVERQTFVEKWGMTQPAPAPRFSRTVPELDQPPAYAGENSREVLADWGIARDRVDTLLASGAVVAAQS